MNMERKIRVIVYTLTSGKENIFELRDVEEEQHERAKADRALHDPKSMVACYRFEWRDKKDYESETNNL